MLQSYIDKKKVKDAWKLVQDVTGMKLHKSVTEAVYHGDWVRHPDNQWQIGQIQNIKNDQAEVVWKKIDKRKKAVVSTHHVKDLQHARREFSQLNQPTHHKEMVSPDILPKAGAGQDGTATLVNTYKNDTPGQGRKIKTFKEFN
jgi:ribosomal protein L21E